MLCPFCLDDSSIYLYTLAVAVQVSIVSILQEALSQSIFAINAFAALRVSARALAFC